MKVGQGDAAAAKGVLAALLATDPGNPLARVLAASIDAQRREQAREELRHLVDRLDANGVRNASSAQADSGYARPRVLSLLGPQSLGGTAETEAAALLYRLGIRAALEQRGGITVVDRDAIQDALQELHLSASDLSDSRARATIGRLLPASLILSGHFTSMKGSERLSLQLVDTETLQLLAAFSTNVSAAAEIGSVSEAVSLPIAETIAASRPLSARVFHRKGDSLQAGIGEFHGAREGMAFTIVQRKPKGAPGDFSELKVGTARVASLGKIESTLTAEWLKPGGWDLTGSVWVMEANGAAPGRLPPAR